MGLNNIVSIVCFTSQEAAGVLANQGLRKVVESAGCEIEVTVLSNGTSEGLEGKVSYDEFVNSYRDRSFVCVSSSAPQIDFSNRGMQKPIVVHSADELASIFSSIDLLPLLANYSRNNTIALKTTLFYDQKGEHGFVGGAERYLQDLFRVSEELGIRLDVYQYSSEPFFRRYFGMNVIGLAPRNGTEPFSVETTRAFSEEFEILACNYGQLRVYSSFFESPLEETVLSGSSIGISHGIFWDSPDAIWEKREYLLDYWDSIIRHIKSCDKIVSVDTNTLNWLQTTDFQSAMSCQFVPNYVDTYKYHPLEAEAKKTSDKLVVLYPRRLYSPRGFDMVIDVVPDILEIFENVEFHFVGRGVESDLAKADELISSYPGKVFRYEKMPDEMPSVYQKSDITLVPTLHSEGTSLSCLEAMASENLVIASRVGGIPDLIIDGYNGMLIDPNAESLRNALVDAITNYDKYSTMQINARAMAKSFSLEKWAGKWSKIFEDLCLRPSKVEAQKMALVYLLGTNELDDETIAVIRRLLIDGLLVYVILDDVEDALLLHKKYGHMRLQFLSTDCDIDSNIDLIYASESMCEKYKLSSVWDGRNIVRCCGC